MQIQISASIMGPTHKSQQGAQLCNCMQLSPQIFQTAMHAPLTQPESFKLEIIASLKLYTSKKSFRQDVSFKWQQPRVAGLRPQLNEHWFLIVSRSACTLTRDVWQKWHEAKACLMVMRLAILEHLKLEMLKGRDVGETQGNDHIKRIVISHPVYQLSSSESTFCSAV